MKPASTPHLPRARTIAIFTAGATGITAAIATSSLLMSGCVPCEDPNGCTTRPSVVSVTLTLDPKPTYTGYQEVSILAPTAEGIYFSTNGAIPDDTSCTEWNGEPIPINDSTILRVFAKGDGINYRSKSVKATYKLTASPYTERTALDGWIQLERAALAALYCANNGCLAPPVTILQNEFQWTADCPQGGSVIFDNSLLMTLAATFTYVGCTANDVTADGAIVLSLDVSKLPTIIVNGSGVVSLSGSGYTAELEDHTVRKYSLSGSEGYRTGGYQIGCEGDGCASADVNYYYGGGNTLWINDPAVNNTCSTPAP